LVAIGQRYFVHYEVGAAVVGKGQDRDARRRITPELGLHIHVEAAGVEFDQTVQPGLAAVGFKVVFLLEKRPLLDIVCGRAPRE
jgi:hypothetical protein